jgi:hypothetical protein
MIWYVLNHVAVLVREGHMNQASHLLSQLLTAEQHHPGVTAMIHRFMYSIHPDWGL